MGMDYVAIFTKYHCSIVVNANHALTINDLQLIIEADNEFEIYARGDALLVALAEKGLYPITVQEES